MEKVETSLIIDQNQYQARPHLIHKFMRFLVISIGIVTPVVSGYWRYSTTSDPNPLLSGIFLGAICVFFSLGLWLSVTKVGRRFKWLTLFLLLIGIPFHIQASSYPFYFLPVFIVAGLYAFYSLFRRQGL